MKTHTGLAYKQLHETPLHLQIFQNGAMKLGVVMVVVASAPAAGQARGHRPPLLVGLLMPEPGESVMEAPALLKALGSRGCGMCTQV